MGGLREREPWRRAAADLVAVTPRVRSALTLALHGDIARIDFATSILAQVHAAQAKLHADQMVNLTDQRDRKVAELRALTSVPDDAAGGEKRT